MLFVPKEKDAMLIFMVKTISMLLIWGIIIRMLWRFRKVGRTLFAAFTIISLYTLVDMLQVLEYPIVDKTDNILRYLFAILLVLKTILTCSCMFKKCAQTLQCAVSGADISSMKMPWMKMNNYLMMMRMKILCREYHFKMMKRSR